MNVIVNDKNVESIFRGRRNGIKENEGNLDQN